jgi:hypothetical protein
LDISIGGEKEMNERFKQRIRDWIFYYLEGREKEGRERESLQTTNN